jgi:ribosomal-protein-alanine N-acetyltransferase
MTRADLFDVASVERLSFEDPWTKADFELAIKDASTITLVAVTQDEYVAAYIVYRIYDRGVTHIMNVAVGELGGRRCGIGTQLVDWVKAKLKAGDELLINVRETNLVAQLFFKANDFKAVRLIRNGYANGEDSILFEWRKVV